MDQKEKVILSVAGGLATITIGYLVWRHEQTISSANTASQQAQDQAAQDAYLQQLESVLSTPSVAVGAGASGSSYDTGTTSNVTPAGNSDLQAILSAFFGDSGGTGGGTGTVPPVPSPLPAKPVGPVKSTPNPVGVSGVTGLPRPTAPTIPATGESTGIPSNPITNPNLRFYQV